jgi:GNAT superfamily N-acetyltransferase
MNVEIRPLTVEDIPGAMELKNALGWNQTPEDWRRFLELSPGGGFKAVVGKRLVATAIAYVFDRVCWIGMVIVRDDFRHRGVGRRIMGRCLEFSAEKNCSLVVLDATREGVSLYSGLGFRPEYLVGTVRGTVSRQDTRNRNPEGLRIRRIDFKDLDPIVSLEACALGAVREALLVYLVREHPGRGFVCRDTEGRLQGFVLYRRGHHSVQVGPMIARGDEPAGHLLGAVVADLCSFDEPAAVVLTVPMNNSGMQRLLRSYRLSADPRLTRMTRGRKRLHAREDLVYALSGPEKG